MCTYTLCMCVCIYTLFYLIFFFVLFCFWLHCPACGICLLTRDWTCIPCSESVESWPMVCQRSLCIFSPLWFILGYWIYISVLYSRNLSIHSIYFSLYLLTPISYSIAPPILSALEATSLFSMSMSIFLFHTHVHLYHILDSTFKWYHLVFVFLCVPHFT